MWLATDEVVSLGKSDRWVREKLKTGEWKSRETARRGRNGKLIREVLLESLPEDMQATWAKRNLGTDEMYVEESSAPVLSQAEALARALSGYDVETREAFIDEINRLNSIVDRFENISPRSVVRDGARVFVVEVESLCEEARCTNTLILKLEPSRAKKVSGYTLEKWARQRKRDGLMTFLRAQPTQRKQRDGRAAQFSADARDWLDSNWKNYPTTSHCIKKLKEQAKKKRWKIPSNSTLRRMLKVPPVVRAIVFGKDTDYTGKLKPYVPRTVEDLAALQIVCGDHHILDVIAWSDVQKSLVRLWFTVWQCVRTGLIWGWHLDYIPSSHTIACAYANGVLTFGAQPFSRPQDGFKSLAYTDNGKDYKGRNVNGDLVVHKHAAEVDGGLQLILTSQSVGLLNDAGVEQMLANFYNGREKPVERTFNDTATAIQNDFFRRGWCGRNTKDKPDAYKELYTRHMKAMKRKQPSPFPSEQEVRDYIADWVFGYNTTEHERTTLGGAKIVPLTEFNRLYTTRYEISKEAVALMLLKPTRGTLGKNGLSILGATYTSEAFSKYKGVKGADGKPLQIEARRSDDNYSTVWAVLPDGQVVEATRLDRSPILNPNRETHRVVAMLAKHETKLAREFNLFTQSRLRGETVEDRAAALIDAEYGSEIELPLAVGANADAQTQARVQRLTRLDGKRLHAVPQARVTAEQVSNVQTDDSIFESSDRTLISEFDFEE
ncbi:MAG: hypothetical protein AUG51_16910 [Acidobacteria bacterium 13_1_20CM_3_53_8]|nr:MAG: hypothetical protein AUG51_16910 [Acidobacteria bacterium 13_1_20CM_3_53_8]